MLSLKDPIYLLYISKESFADRVHDLQILGGKWVSVENVTLVEGAKE